MYSKGDFLKRVIIISHAQLRQHMLENGLLSYLLTSPSDGCDLFLCSYEYIIMRFIFSEYTDFSESHTVLSIGSSSVMDSFPQNFIGIPPLLPLFGGGSVVPRAVGTRHSTYGGWRYLYIIQSFMHIVRWTILNSILIHGDERRSETSCRSVLVESRYRLNAGDRFMKSFPFPIFGVDNCLLGLPFQCGAARSCRKWDGWVG